MAVSCKDNPTKFIEIPVDMYKSIPTYPENYSSYSIRDNDTLKIKIKDSIVANLIKPPFTFLSVSGELSRDIIESPPFVYELITSDLKIKQNPENKAEIWILGFQPNLDSNRRYIPSRFDYYGVDLEFSILNPYYRDVHFLLDVESSTE